MKSFPVEKRVLGRFSGKLNYCCRFHIWFHMEASFRSKPEKRSKLSYLSVSLQSLLSAFTRMTPISVSDCQDGLLKFEQQLKSCSSFYGLPILAETAACLNRRSKTNKNSVFDCGVYDNHHHHCRWL